MKKTRLTIQTLPRQTSIHPYIHTDDKEPENMKTPETLKKILS
jgi:hypothetical protein